MTHVDRWGALGWQIYIERYAEHTLFCSHISSSATETKHRREQADQFQDSPEGCLVLRSSWMESFHHPRQQQWWWNPPGKEAMSTRTTDKRTNNMMYRLLKERTPYSAATSCGAPQYGSSSSTTDRRRGHAEGLLESACKSIHRRKVHMF